MEYQINRTFRIPHASNPSLYIIVGILPITILILVMLFDSITGITIINEEIIIVICLFVSGVAISLLTIHAKKNLSAILDACYALGILEQTDIPTVILYYAPFASFNFYKYFPSKRKRQRYIYIPSKGYVTYTINQDGTYVLDLDVHKLKSTSEFDNRVGEQSQS